MNEIRIKGRHQIPPDNLPVVSVLVIRPYGLAFFELSDGRRVCVSDDMAADLLMNEAWKIAEKQKS